MNQRTGLVYDLTTLSTGRNIGLLEIKVSVMIETQTNFMITTQHQKNYFYLINS